MESINVKDSSEVLARKYRPSNFDELIGQESIAQTLSLALDSNRLSHAYLFSGLRGSGKTSTARIFAKALLCEKGISHHPCGECESCLMAIENRHVDIVEMDGASSRKIDDIRDLVEQTKYRPALSRFKVFIIDEVHMLTKEAFNALLKTLEEPPEYVKFILATTDPLKLPPTILSRTQHFRFKTIAQSKVLNHLIHILNLEKIEFEQEALAMLARSGGGSLRDTLTLLDQAIVYSKNYVDVQTVTDMLGLVDPKFLAQLFESIFEKDYEKIIEFTKRLEDYEAQMVVDELIVYLKERMYARDAKFSTLVIERFFRILSDSKSLLHINADGSFVLSLVFFKMVEALKIKEIDEMIESFEKDTQIIQTPTPPKVQTPSLQVTQPTTQTTPPTPPLPEVKQDNSKENFANLIIKIKDRNIALGECFEQSVTFVSYENNILTWESCSSDKCKQALKHGYSVIKHLVREIFGFATNIKGVACTKEKTPPTPPQQEMPPIQTYEEEQPYIEEPTSMVEEAEIGGSMSCVAHCNEENTPTLQEVDRDSVLKTPMVEKALELFEAKKVTILSKI